MNDTKPHSHRLRSGRFSQTGQIYLITVVTTSRLGQPVWQRGFHDHAVRREEDLQALARYVVANPVRAGLVQRTGLYPHWDAIWV